MKVLLDLVISNSCVYLLFKIQALSTLYVQ